MTNSGVSFRYGTFENIKLACQRGGTQYNKFRLVRFGTFCDFVVPFINNHRRACWQHKKRSSRNKTLTRDTGSHHADTTGYDKYLHEERSPVDTMRS